MSFSYPGGVDPSKDQQDRNFMDDAWLNQSSIGANAPFTQNSDFQRGANSILAGDPAQQRPGFSGLQQNNPGGQFRKPPAPGDQKDPYQYLPVTHQSPNTFGRVLLYMLKRSPALVAMLAVVGGLLLVYITLQIVNLIR